MKVAYDVPAEFELSYYHIHLHTHTYAYRHRHPHAHAYITIKIENMNLIFFKTDNYIKISLTNFFMIIMLCLRSIHSEIKN